MPEVVSDLTRPTVPRNEHGIGIFKKMPPGTATKCRTTIKTRPVCWLKATPTQTLVTK